MRINSKSPRTHAPKFHTFRARRLVAHALVILLYTQSIMPPVLARGDAAPRPPGTYGRFTAAGHTTLVLGAENSPEPSVYNLESLALSGGSVLRVAGPVVLTVKSAVTLTGSTAGNANDPRQLVLRSALGPVTVGGGAVLYALVRAPQSSVVLEGRGRLRGTVACDRLRVSGNGLLQVTEGDLPPPPVNRYPTVDAGPDQTVTLPTWRTGPR